MSDPLYTTTPLTAQVEVDAADYVLKEIGAEINLTAPRSWYGRNASVADLFQEPLSASIMLEPKQMFSEYSNPALADWTKSGTSGHWELLSTSPAFDKMAGILHRDASDATRHTAETTANWKYNPSCMIGLYLFQPDDEEQDYVELTWGVGTAHPLVLRLGNGFSPEIDFEGSTYIIDVANPISTKDFHRQALRIWVFFIRDSLVFHSNFCDSFIWSPPDSVWADPYWTDDEANQHTYLATQGHFKVSAVGMFVFNAVQNQYATSGSYFTTFKLPYIPTVSPDLTYDAEDFVTGAISAVATPALRKVDDSGAYATGDQTGSVKVTLTTNDAGWTPIILGYKVIWAPASNTKAVSPHTPYVEVLNEVRTWDATADMMTLKIWDDGTYAEFDLKPSMRCNVSINNVSRLHGYSDEPHGITVGPDREFVLHIRDRMRRLQMDMLLTEFNADGLSPEDAIRELIYRAGIPDSEIITTASGYQLPSSGSEVEPAMLFLATSNILECIMRIKEAWLPDWRFYCDPDGNFVLVPWATLQAGAIKRDYRTGSDDKDVVFNLDLLIRGEIDRWTDDSDFKNFITVMGVDANVQPITATRLDQDSVTDPNNVNYVGEWRKVVYADVTLQRQEDCEVIADRIQARYGSIWRYYRFRIKYDPEMFPGDVISITKFHRDGVTEEYKVKAIITDIDADIERRMGEMTLTCKYLGDL